MNRRRRRATPPQRPAARRVSGRVGGTPGRPASVHTRRVHSAHSCKGAERRRSALASLHTMPAVIARLRDQSPTARERQAFIHPSSASGRNASVASSTATRCQSGSSITAWSLGGAASSEGARDPASGSGRIVSRTGARRSYNASHPFRAAYHASRFISISPAEVAFFLEGGRAHDPPRPHLRAQGDEQRRRARAGHRRILRSRVLHRARGCREALPRHRRQPRCRDLAAGSTHHSRVGRTQSRAPRTARKSPRVGDARARTRSALKSKKWTAVGRAVLPPGQCAPIPQRHPPVAHCASMRIEARTDEHPSSGSGRRTGTRRRT